MRMKDNQSQKDAIERELRRIEEDCIHSGKSHFSAAIFWTRINYLLGVSSLIVSAAAGIAFLKDIPLLAGLSSFLAAALTALITFLKPSEKSATHKSSGDQYLGLRNDSRISREIQLPYEGEIKTSVDSVKNLAKRRNELNQASPQFSRKNFEIARTGIEAGEATYYVDKRGDK
jgi:hypothetical protein